jgi:hypothetical protein
MLIHHNPRINVSPHHLHVIKHEQCGNPWLVRATANPRVLFSSYIFLFRLFFPPTQNGRTNLFCHKMVATVQNIPSLRSEIRRMRRREKVKGHGYEIRGGE